MTQVQKICNNNAGDTMSKKFCVVLGILLIARSGRKTRTVRIADRLRFSVMTQYSSALYTDHTRSQPP